MKSQILAGGRGLGKFTNGFQGGVHIVHKDKVRQLACTPAVTSPHRSRRRTHCCYSNREPGSVME